MIDGGRDELSLSDGERLVWSGRPSRVAFVLSAGNLLEASATLAFGGFFLATWTRAWFNGTLVVLFPTVLLATILIYLMVGRFFVNWYLRSGTRYFLTTHRVLIRRRALAWTRTVERATTDIVSVEKDIASDGSGTIRFDPEPRLLGIFRRRRGLAEWHGPGIEGVQFFRIPDASQVVELVQTSTTFLPASAAPQQ